MISFTSTFEKKKKKSAFWAACQIQNYSTSHGKLQNANISKSHFRGNHLRVLAFYIRLCGFTMFTATLYYVICVGLPWFLVRQKMEVFWLIFLHQTIVVATRTPSKMASTLCQNEMKPFRQKSWKFYIVQIIQFIFITKNV